MSLTAWILTAAALVAVSAILAEYRGTHSWRYLLKPLPVLLLMAVVGLSESVDSAVGVLFIFGLILSATGDVILIDRRRFVHGLSAFLLAHIAYIFAFWLMLRDAPRLWIVVLLSLWGGVLLWRLKSQLGKLLLPVFGYITVINVMIWLAVEVHAGIGTPESRLLAIGALLFGVSDTVLALDHFRSPFPGSKALILVTYYLAQACMAVAVASIVL